MTRQPTPQELEPYLIFCAELLDEYGPCMQPWLDRFEAEYYSARKPPEVDRIKKLIADARREDGRE